jgi:membrane protease YdiL (CAAX protease family)
MVIAFAIAATVLVYRDARTHLRPTSARVWAIVTLVTAGLAAPAYVIARPSRGSTWGLSEVVALPVFFVVSILPIAILMASWAMRRGLLSPFGSVVAAMLVQNIVLGGVTLYIVLVKYRLRPASLGITGGAWARRLLAAAIASGAALAGNFIGQNLTVFAAGLFLGQQAATEMITQREADTPVFRMLQEFRAPTQMAVLVVLVAGVVPIGEELFFRGLTYGALRRVLNRHTAVLASAVFFAAAHLQVVEFLPILILGMILAYLYDLTGSLVPGMIAHAVNNLGALVLFYMTRMPGP